MSQKSDERTLKHFFEEACVKYSSLNAVEFQSESITYGQLNRKTNQLVEFIRKTNPSLKTGDFLGICVRKSIELIISIFCCWKLGCIYFPIDPNLPENRIKFMIIEDTKCKAIVCEDATSSKFRFLKEDSTEEEEEEEGECLKDRFSKVNLIRLTRKIFTEKGEDNSALEGTVTLENPEDPKDFTSSSIAYITYTSGSTGKPKAIVQEHLGAWNIYSVLSKRMGMKCPGDRILLFSSISFDEHLNTISTMFHGSTVVICPEEVRYGPGQDLWSFIEMKNIDTIKLTPSVLQSLPQKKFSKVKSISIMGEVCAPPTMDYWAGQASHFIHLYGSQETILDHSKRWKKGDLYGNVGQVFGNYKCYLLDSDMKPVPLGKSGQVYISGPPIKRRGYFNRPSDTRTKFIMNPFFDASQPHLHSVLYRTGDYGYLLKNGDLVFANRKDRQVKLHGMRIELGEISQAINSSGLVESCYVGLKETKKKRKLLIAYLILPKKIQQTETEKVKEEVEGEEEQEDNNNEKEDDDEEEKNEIQVRKYLEKRLPYYMIPHLFIYRQNFPLTVSGKLDIRKLLDFNVQEYIKQYFVPPTTTEEEKLQKIFTELLLDDDEDYEVGIMDDFFALGGSSLTILLLIRRIEEVFCDVKVNYLSFLQISDLTIKNICHLLFHSSKKNEIGSTINEEDEDIMMEEKLVGDDNDNFDPYQLTEETKRFLREFDENHHQVLDMTNGSNGILYRLMKPSDLEECIELDLQSWHGINPLYIHTGITKEEDREVTRLFLSASIKEETGLVAIDRTSKKCVMINGGYSSEAVEICCSQIPEEISSNSPNRPIGALYQTLESYIPKESLIHPIMNAGSLAKRLDVHDAKRLDVHDDENEDVNINVMDIYFKMELLLQLLGQKKGYKTFLDDPNSPITQEYARKVSPHSIQRRHKGIKFDEFEWPEGSGLFPLAGVREGYISYVRNNFGESKAKMMEKIEYDSLFYLTRDWRKKLMY